MFLLIHEDGRLSQQGRLNSDDEELVYQGCLQIVRYNPDLKKFEQIAVENTADSDDEDSEDLELESFWEVI